MAAIYGLIVRLVGRQYMIYCCICQICDIWRNYPMAAPQTLVVKPELNWHSQILPTKLVYNITLSYLDRLV